MDPEQTMRLLELFLEINDRLIQPIGIGVAGGLGPGVMSMLDPLTARHSALSIDAEGHLRDEDDHLSLWRVEHYLTRAFEKLEGT